MRRLVYLLLVLTLSGCDRPAPTPPGFQVAEVLGGVGAAGFARATAVRHFRFPADHGPHPAYRNEWWYLTGNLRASDGREFGFQVTFFRIALTPAAVTGDSAWRSNQVWMAHAALSDIAGDQHLAYERFARQALGLAGAQRSPVRVWLEDWRLQRDEHTDSWRLQLPTEGFDLSLQLLPASPVILQGDQGLSRKSSEPGNASYYYSVPRLQASGQLRLNGQSLAVHGLAWFDREWSTSALGPEQSGWDWFSLQLLDGRNLMYYQLRRKDGGTDPHSSGSLSDAGGLQRRLDPSQVTLTPLASWSAGDRRYPIEWRLQLLNEPHPWRVRALLADQEMRLSVRYWEGAVDVIDEVSGKPLGRGYLEMAGAER
jgi:predicted secreted hydrolase